MNIPNQLTILRIILTAFFVFFIFAPGLTFKALALAVFSAAALTDWLDGKIAKSRNLITNFGKIMDPIADKILVLGAFLSFIQLQLIPAWTVVVIIGRESAITSLRLFALSKGRVIAASKGGKYKTVSQMASIFIILISLIFKEAFRMGCYSGQRAVVGLPIAQAASYPEFDRYSGIVVYLAMLLTVILTLISGVSYIWDNRMLFSEAKDEK